MSKPIIPKYSDLIGKKYNFLTVISVYERSKDNKPLFKFKCDCGNSKKIRFYPVKSGNTKSCGCIAKEASIKNIKIALLKKVRNLRSSYENEIGQKYSKLTIIGINQKISPKGILVDTICDCGKLKTILHYRIKNNHTKSCGCLESETRLLNIKNTTHGFSKHELYQTFKGINNRCYNTKAASYHDYGGRNITNYWKDDPGSFIKYVLENIGNKPSKKHSLDRIDNNRNYEPGNIKWSTRLEQSKNSRKRIRNSHYDKLLLENELLKKEIERLMNTPPKN